jgi:hypothetical protein
MSTEIPATAALPLPVHDDNKSVSVMLSRDLYGAARKEMKRRKLSVRQVLEWGLGMFLLSTNPQEAQRLGIRA